MYNDSVLMPPVEDNHTNGSVVVENRLRAAIIVFWYSACALLSLLLLLPYIPLLRAAWRLPKREILPWILLSLFITAAVTAARRCVLVISGISQERFSEWKLPVDIHCKPLLSSLAVAYIAINTTPLVFALIEITTMRRPGLASKQWLFNSVGFIGTWMVAIGAAMPYANLTFVSENPCTAEYDYQYVIGIIERFLFALSVYALLLLYLSLASQPKWKPNHRLAMEAMACNLLLFNGLLTTTVTLVIVRINASPSLIIIFSGLLGLADTFWSFNGLVIFCRYKQARQLAKNMLPCCWVKHRTQSTN